MRIASNLSNSVCICLDLSWYDQIGLNSFPYRFNRLNPSSSAGPSPHFHKNTTFIFHEKNCFFQRWPILAHTQIFEILQICIHFHHSPTIPARQLLCDWLIGQLELKNERHIPIILMRPAIIIFIAPCLSSIFQITWNTICKHYSSRSCNGSLIIKCNRKHTLPSRMDHPCHIHSA